MVYINNSTPLTLTIAQLIPDSSIAYKVMFAFESGGSSNGTVSSGVPVPTGVFQDVSEGDNVFSFKGLSEGIVILDVTVQSSQGLERKGKIALTVRDVDFSFSAQLNTPANKIFVDEDVKLNFDFTEKGKSDLPYEMTYSPAVINVTNMNYSPRDMEVNRYTTIPVVNGTSTPFYLTFQPLTEGENTVTFTIRNSITKKSKSYNVKFDAVTRPSVVVTATSLEHVHHGGFASWDHKDLNVLHIGYTVNKDSRRTVTSVKINFPNKGETFDLPVDSQGDYAGWHDFRLNDGSDSVYGGQPYTITITDSKGDVGTTEKQDLHWNNR